MTSVLVMSAKNWWLNERNLEHQSCCSKRNVRRAAACVVAMAPNDRDRVCGPGVGIVWIPERSRRGEMSSCLIVSVISPLPMKSLSHSDPVLLLRRNLLLVPLNTEYDGISGTSSSSSANGDSSGTSSEFVLDEVLLCEGGDNVKSRFLEDEDE